LTAKTIKLSLELVPSSCWFSNVRSAVSRTQWDRIRKRVYAEAYDTCQICGGIGEQHPVECHEIWHYDDKKLIQKLEGMIALCPSCHVVKHFGLAQIQGRGEKALKHLMKVNKMKRKDADQYITNAFTIWAERSSKLWKLDISILQNYGINVEEIKKART
jgi:hypothetical protein